jgi:hypothetical protein
MKKLKFQHPTERWLIFIIVMLIAALLSVLWFYGERINILWQQNGNGDLYTNSQNDQAQVDATTKFYIQTAIKSLYNQLPVTDPLQNRVYFPEARFYVPLSDLSRAVVYRYTDAQSGNFPAMLTATTNSNINQLPNTFGDVPCMQRHLQINIDSTKYPEDKLMATTKLNDGRTLYIYSHAEGNCNDPRWDQYSAEKLVDIFKQAKSY